MLAVNNHSESRGGVIFHQKVVDTAPCSWIVFLPRGDSRFHFLSLEKVQRLQHKSQNQGERDSIFEHPTQASLSDCFFAYKVALNLAAASSVIGADSELRPSSDAFDFK